MCLYYRASEFGKKCASKWMLERSLLASIDSRSAPLSDQTEFHGPTLSLSTRYARPVDSRLEDSQPGEGAVN